MAEAWKEERDAALLSLDEAQIRRYAKRWGIWMPAEESPFWAGVHRARLSLPLSEEEHEQSIAWLAEHNFAPRSL